MHDLSRWRNYGYSINWKGDLEYDGALLWEFVWLLDYFGYIVTFDEIGRLYSECIESFSFDILYCGAGEMASPVELETRE
jgi:hypothetical protein